MYDERPKPRPSRLPNLLGEIEVHLQQSEALPPADEAGWMQETSRLTGLAQEMRQLLQDAEEDHGWRLRIPKEAIPKRSMSVHRGDKELQWARQKLRNAEEEHDRLTKLLEDPEQEHIKELRALEREIDAENKRQKQLAAENRQRERTLARAAADDAEADGDARAQVQIERLDAELQVWRTKNASLEKQVQQAAAALQKATDDQNAVRMKMQQVEEQLGGEGHQNRLAEQRRKSEEETERRKSEEASLQEQIAKLQESRRSAAKSHERHAKDSARRRGNAETQKAELEAKLAHLDQLERQLRRQQLNAHPPQPRRSRLEPQQEASKAERTEDERDALAAFLSHMVSRHGDVVRAWRRSLDVDGDGRLRFEEFVGGCKRAGYSEKLKTLWNALDLQRKGFIELIDLDPEAGQKLDDFRDFLEEHYWTLEDAWERLFDRNGSRRCTKDEFVASCAHIGWPGDALQMFGWLDLSGTNLTLDEMGIIGMRLRKVPITSAKERVRERQARDAVQADAMLQKFRAHLKKRYGNLVRAWKSYLDPDGDGKLQFTEFCARCRELNFQGNLKALWLSLDQKGTGYVSLDELDPEFRAATESQASLAIQRRFRMFKSMARMGDASPSAARSRASRKEGDDKKALDDFRSFLVSKHGDVVRGWRRSLDVDGDGRLQFQEFVAGCKEAGYQGELKTIWNALVKGKGFVELVDLDPEAGQKLDDFRDFLEENYRTLDDVWERVFDCNGSGRCTKDDFVTSCARIGWPGDALQMFGWLDLSGTNIILDEMGIIGMSRRKKNMMSARDRVRERQARDAEQAEAMLQKFRDHLKRRYGSLVKAWSSCLDPDGDGKLQFTEFCAKCRELNFQGNLKALWLSLDQDGTGYVSLDELDPEFRAASESQAAVAIQRRFRGQKVKATSVARMGGAAPAARKSRANKRASWMQPVASTQPAVDEDHAAAEAADDAKQGVSRPRTEEPKSADEETAAEEPARRPSSSESRSASKRSSLADRPALEPGSARHQRPWRPSLIAPPTPPDQRPRRRSSKESRSSTGSVPEPPLPTGALAPPKLVTPRPSGAPPRRPSIIGNIEPVLKTPRRSIVGQQLEPLTDAAGPGVDSTAVEARPASGVGIQPDRRRPSALLAVPPASGPTPNFATVSRLSARMSPASAAKASPRSPRPSGRSESPRPSGRSESPRPSGVPVPPAGPKPDAGPRLDNKGRLQRGAGRANIFSVGGSKPKAKAAPKAAAPKAAAQPKAPAQR